MTGFSGPVFAEFFFIKVRSGRQHFSDLSGNIRAVEFLQKKAVFSGNLALGNVIKNFMTYSSGDGGKNTTDDHSGKY